MTITKSSNQFVALAAGVAVAASLFVGAFAAPAQAAALTQTQISSIVSLLQSFGADAATIANVQASLNGQPTSGTGSTGSTGGSASCSVSWTQDLQVGSTGAAVKSLQQILNKWPETMIAASGAGSPGNETMTFGPATKAAVIKFQTKYGVTPAAGYFGAKSRAQLMTVCSTGGSTGTTPTGPGLTISAGAQPANALAPNGASRVPFTTFTITNNSGMAQTITGVTVERVGLGVDANFSGVALIDSANNIQLGTAKTLNSNHQATIGDTFMINPGQTMTLTVAGNIQNTTTAYSGQIVSLKVVAVNTTAPVAGSLPVMGASHTINTTLTLGSVSTSTSSYDPGATQARNIGDVGVRFSGVKFQAGSAEDLRLYSIRWRQVGSASASDLANLKTYINGTSYPAMVDSTGKYYTTVFPGGVVIPKGNTADVYIQGDITGALAAQRTVDFDIDKNTDVYFVGQTYGYGVAVSGSYTPWFNGYVANVSGGTVTTISKANSGKAAAQNVAINVVNQPLGGFTTNFTGEAVSVQQMTFTIATSSLTATGDSHFTNISLVDENGAVVASGVDASNAASGQTFTLTDTVTFPTGAHTYYLQGKIPSTVTAGSFAVSTTPSSGWSNVTGQSTGNTVSLSGAGAVTMNSMTVKGGAVAVSLSTTPASQNVVAGASNLTFANVVLDAGQSGEDVRTSAIPLYFTSTGNASNVTGCSLFDGSTQLTTGSRVVNSLTSGAKTNFQLDNILRITKGTSKTISVNCNLSSAATSSSTYYFTTVGLSASSDFSVTGDTSGVSITPSVTANAGGTMTVQSASLAISVDSSSPASTTVAGGNAGQTVAVYKLRATNDTVTLNKIGMTLTAGSASSVTKVWLFNGATQIGWAQFGAGQTVATSTLDTPLTLPADTDVKVTVKADFADIGTGKPGTEGAVVQINPNSAEGTGSTGLVMAGGSGTTGGVRTYNSVPTFTYSTAGATLTAGVTDLLTLNVAADAQGDIGLYQLRFQLATSTISGVTAVTLTGPSGVVHSAASYSPDANGIVTVLFNNTSNTGDATVGSGSSKTYTLRGTVNFGAATSGSVSTSLIGDTAASSSMAQAASVSVNSGVIWSPLATTSRDTSTNDWVNGYALPGCFKDVGLGNNCTARVLAK
jgi:hypothetical protein